MTVFWCGERMMRCRPTIIFFVVFKHWEVNHPQWTPGVFEQTIRFTKFAVTDLYAQRTDRVVDHFCLICTKENQIAILRACFFQDLSQCRIVMFFTIGDCKPSRPLASSLTLM